MPPGVVRSRSTGRSRVLMDPVVAMLVIGSAVLHPVREVFIKESAYPEGLAYAVTILFALLAGLHVAVAGSDPWAALEVWPLAVASGVALIAYFLCTVMCLKLGDVSVYYPIMRSSPLFVVVAGHFVLGQRYPFVLLAGIAIVLVSAFLLQYERGNARLFANRRALLLAIAAMCAHGVLTLVDAEAMRSVRPEEFMLLTNTGVVLPGFAGAFGIFLLRQFFLNIPRELEDAARIDGSGFFGTYWRIMLPLAKPAMVTLGVFIFLNEWSSFVWPLIILSDWKKYPVTVGIALFRDVNQINWPAVFAGSTIVSFPIVILFVLAQEYIIGGISLSGLKG